MSHSGTRHVSAGYMVAGDTWLQALQTLQKVARMGRRAGSEVTVEFGPDEVRLTYAGTAVAVPATGQGEGRGNLSAAYLPTLVAVTRYLGHASIEIVVQDGELHIDNSIVDCRWIDSAPSAIQLPLDATLRDILMLRYRSSQEELVASGLAACLFEAEARKADLVSRAAETLAPLGISLPALDGFVREWLKNGLPTPTNRG